MSFTARHLSIALGLGVLGGGIGGAFLARALASQLYGLEPGDLPTIGMALAALAARALAAGAAPLWRASRVDPARALMAL